MEKVDQMMAEYSDDHRVATNQVLHKICVPLIVISLIGLLASIPVPRAVSDAVPWLNWGTAALLALVAGYLLVAPRLGAGMVPAGVLVAFAVSALDALPGPLWVASAAVFVIAWIGQFIGHGAEGKRPSFFRDLRFLLIGPLWTLAGLYRLLGIRY